MRLPLMRASSDRDDDVLSRSDHRRLPMMDLSIVLPDKKTTTNPTTIKKRHSTFTRSFLTCWPLLLCVSSPSKFVFIVHAPPWTIILLLRMQVYTQQPFAIRINQVDGICRNFLSNPQSRERKERSSSLSLYQRVVRQEKLSVHKLRFDASVIARIIGSFDLRLVSCCEGTAGYRTHVTPLSE